MAETTTTDGSTTDGSSGSQSITDMVTGFVTSPLGMAFVAGVVLMVVVFVFVL